MLLFVLSMRVSGIAAVTFSFIYFACASACARFYDGCRTHDWKLLRFLRGHGSSVEKAAAAYAAMRKYWFSSGMVEIRQNVLSDSGFSPDEEGFDITLETVHANLVWPYFAPRFAPLMEVWGGAAPSVHHGYDEFQNIISFTIFTSFKLSKVVDAGLSELFLDAARYFNVYCDLPSPTTLRLPKLADTAGHCTACLRACSIGSVRRC